MVAVQWVQKECECFFSIIVFAIVFLTIACISWIPLQLVIKIKNESTEKQDFLMQTGKQAQIFSLYGSLAYLTFSIYQLQAD